MSHKGNGSQKQNEIITSHLLERILPKRQEMNAGADVAER